MIACALVAFNAAPLIAFGVTPSDARPNVLPQSVMNDEKPDMTVRASPVMPPKRFPSPETPLPNGPRSQVTPAELGMTVVPSTPRPIVFLMNSGPFPGHVPPDTVFPEKMQFLTMLLSQSTA